MACSPAQIAKTLSLRIKDRTLLIVASGTARLNNRKIKDVLGGKPRMLTQPTRSLTLTGHPVGGVCPIGLATPQPVYCDVSLKAFDEVVPAAGSANSALRISPVRMAELVKAEMGRCPAMQEVNEMNEKVDVLIIGSRGLGRRRGCWSLADSQDAHPLHSEQGDWSETEPTYPSNGRDWEARLFTDFAIQSQPSRARDRLSDQRRQLTDQGGELQRRRRQHDHVHGALSAPEAGRLQGAQPRRCRR